MIKVLLISAFIAITFGSNFQYDGDVLVLNDNNLNAAIKKFDYILLEFYAQWCGHCKSFAPDYAAYATQVKEKQLDFKVAKLDAGGSEKQSSGKYKVESFPTIILLIKGYPVPYKGDRSADALTVFMNNALSDKLKRLEEIDEVYKFISENNIAVLYFIETINESFLNEYKIVSMIFPQIKFGYTDTAYARVLYSIFQKLYDVDPGQIVLFRNFEEKRKEFNDKLTVQKLADFLIENSTPSFEELDNKNFNSILRNGASAIILFWNHASQDSKEALKLLAPHIKNRIQVLAIHSENNMLNQATSHLQIHDPQFPQLYFQKSAGTIYKFEGIINAENVMRFIYRVNKGYIAKKGKSEPIPTQNGPLIHLVGDSFNKLVVESQKDILVQFCQVSDNKCYIPEFEEFASQIKNVDIAFIDMKENEVEGITIETYPAFKLYRHKLKTNPIDFTAEFGIQNLKQFLKEHLTTIQIEEKSNDL